jgi:hypothetical protein
MTHPRVFDPPTRLESALEALFGLLASPSLRVLNPGPRYPELFPNIYGRPTRAGTWPSTLRSPRSASNIA